MKLKQFTVMLWPKSISDKNIFLMKLSFFFYIICSFQLIASNSFSQNKVTLDIQNGSLESIINKIEEQTLYSFVFNNDDINIQQKFNIKVYEEDLNETIDALFKTSTIKYKIKNNLVVLSKVKKQTEKFTISGTISDAETNETLIGVSIYFPEINAGVTTNEYGFYSITLPEGDYTVSISYLGFTTIEEKISLTQNIQKNYSLVPESDNLDEVVITSNKQKTNIRKPEMSVSKLSISTIKKMPVVMGEVDIIKSALQLPGVTNAGEGTAGFNVRGGASDQNLILLDEATVFNTSHLFGFFSVFNSDVIKDLKLYKGGIPANYGGRVSSVLDIYQKEGNSKDYNFSGGIGLVSARLLAEGPIVKDKSSFVVAGRGSYGHLFLKLANDPNSAYFYDLNTKLNYKINDNNNVFMSGYFGRDVFDVGSLVKNTYGNALLNLRWNHIFSNKLFSNASAIYSDYYYGLTLDFVGINWDSGIKNYNFKYDLKHYLSNKLTLNYGFNSVYYDFNPGTIKPTDDSSGVNADQLAKKYAFEPSLYVSAEHKLSDKLAINYGLRYSMFYRLGNQEINTYADNQAVVFNNDLQIYESATPTGTVKYGKNETISKFNNLEPRLAISYALNREQSIKASYNRMSQYIHLISNTSSATPLDVWAPSGKFIKPQLLDQYALGYFRNFKDGDYSLEAETYFKKGKNRIDYIDGADLIANDAIEQVILNGETRAYGFELLLKKNTGKLNGWLSYTLSRSEQRTPGRTPLETGINNGEWYKAGYDKLHNLSATAAYEFNPKWSFGGIFTYQTGKSATFPNGQYEYQGINIPSYGSRNKNNLPAYHHLDVSATYTPKPNKKKGWQSEWVFSIYNLYARKNAASISFGQNTDTGINEATKLSIFGIVPGISYNFKF
ncbi:outer membrane receptor protein involved in Fe transport [Tenacibaculum adriaticum]|uniref:isocitrate dehydrogenase (NADP(+)) n=1 Tax=Tenacibaculum adriaticum TaxID=413713 RepID=A0A5S5DQD0_9FLAO|nr:TonB-dependent receptor [Tenacibaculum adriaticum]TYP98160.1 outer membrane receptor protein involved in Fe transport [Tenacibaculum adriaticum]